MKSSPTTELISQIILSDGRTLSYEYDPEERITKVIDSVEGTTEYSYNSLGELFTETKNGEIVNKMIYTIHGNMTSKNGVAYTYGNNAWKDLLTKVGDQSITYDSQGNPLSYLGHTLTWEKGRQLKSFDNIQYTYNANGIRTSKTVNGVKHTYTLDGTKILSESWNSNTLVPLYDNEENVCGILYNNTPYYFLKNLQGDIIAITNKNGSVVAKYSYDAWGVCTVTQDSSGCNIANINPFRYRGYYFDTETNLYYLQSRYYNPQVGQFLNADDAKCLNADESAISCNLFTYCINDPVNLTDITGDFSWSSFGKLIKKLVNSISKITTFLLGKYGLKNKTYQNRLKYNTAGKITKLVNNNKKSLKKLSKSSSEIAKALNVLMIFVDCAKIARKSKNLFNAIAEISFYIITCVVKNLASKLVSWILSKIFIALCWARFIINWLLNKIIDRAMSGKWVDKLRRKYVSLFEPSLMSLGGCMVTLFKAAKSCFA